MMAEGIWPGLPVEAHDPRLERAAAGAEARAEMERASEVEAFQLRWEECRGSLRAYLTALLPHGALVEDCLQEVAVVAWQKAPREKPLREFLAYCMACAKRIALASLRKNRHGRLQMLAPEVALALAETVQRQEEAALADPEPDRRIPALRRCLDSLDGRQRSLLEACYGEGGVGGEAKRRGRSADCLYKQLERLRAALRACVVRQLGREW